jgi:hypothetical protein
MAEISVPNDLLQRAAERANQEQRSVIDVISTLMRDYADGRTWLNLPEPPEGGGTLWVPEIQDVADGPWRLMSSEGEPDTMVFAFRTEAEADDMAEGFRQARLGARATEWRRVSSDAG